MFQRFVDFNPITGLFERENPIDECRLAGRWCYKGGGGGGGGTTIQKTEPWDVQKTYYQKGFTQADKLYNSGGFTPAPYAGSTIAAPSAETNAALNMTTARAMAGSPLIDATQQQLGQTLSGNFLSAGNPYMQQALRGAARPTVENFRDAVMPGLEARFAASGRYGSGAMRDQQGKAYDALARNLSEQATQAAMQNYGQERQLMQQAAFAAPQVAGADYQDLEKLAAVGEYRDQYGQERINEDVRRYEANRDKNLIALQRYMDVISGVPGGSTTTGSSSAPRSNPLLGAAGGAMAGSTFGVPGMVLGGLLGAFG